MVWLFVHLKFLIKYYRLVLFPSHNPKGRHWQGTSVMDYPDVAKRFWYYRRGFRTYKLYCGNYSRLNVSN